MTAEYVERSVLDEAANAFVAAMGPGNVRMLAANLRYTSAACDALMALRDALARAYVPEEM